MKKYGLVLYLNVVDVKIETERISADQEGVGGFCCCLYAKKIEQLHDVAG
jgi:hypothetical protein